MSKQLVSDIKDRDQVKAIFLVKDKILAMAKNGKPYMNLRFMDKSGEIEGKIWDNTETLDVLFSKDDFVEIRGKASVYLGKMQVVVAEINRVPDEQINLADFLPESPRGLVEMRQEFLDTVNALTNQHLKELMQAFMADDAFMDMYCKAPAAKGMHHVYLGGLLEHSLALVRLVKRIVPLYDGINEELLIVGALLHDVGKIHEMSYSRSFDYTDAGKLLGHITIGVELLDDRIRSINNFPVELTILLKHMLLSHHGQYEYGSPKRPKTIEATILNYLDDMDSKINGIRAHINKEHANSSRWTSHHRLYDRYFFKGNGIDEGETEQTDFEEGGLPEEPSVNIPNPEPRNRPGNFSNQPLQSLKNLNLF